MTRHALAQALERAMIRPTQPGSIRVTFRYATLRQAPFCGARVAPVSKGPGTLQLAAFSQRSGSSGGLGFPSLRRSKELPINTASGAIKDSPVLSSKDDNRVASLLLGYQVCSPAGGVGGGEIRSIQPHSRAWSSCAFPNNRPDQVCSEFKRGGDRNSESNSHHARSGFHRE
jgi:hypothetical protein